MRINKGIRPMILAVIIIIAAFFLLRRSFSGGIEIKGFEAGKKELVITVAATSTGTIKADTEIKLTSQRMGRVAALHAEEGSVVKKDALVAELDYDELEQRLQIAAAAVQRAEANLSALRSLMISFKTEIDSGIVRSSSILSEAENRLKRMKELREDGYLSQLEFDSVKRDYDIAKANFDSAIAAQQQIRSREDEIRAQESVHRQAVSEYSLARINKGYSFIGTPISGVITARPVKLGETVSVGSLIATVVSTDSLYIEAFIDEADAAKVSAGQTVNVTMDAYAGRTFSGRVYMISPVVLGGKQEARTFEIRVRLDDRNVLLKPGMSADVEIVVGTLADIVVIPSQSIIEKNDEKFVYTVDRGKAVRKSVKTGQFNWSYTQVIQGVKEGDIVITNPDTPGLADGARVRITKQEK